MQTAFAILLVLACLGYVGWQLLRTIKAGNGGVGSCCSSGCSAHDVPADAPTKPREQFIPVDALRRRK